MTREPSAALARELRSAVEGEVRFDAGSRALYATDASNYRQVPIGVVLPRTVSDVIATVEICRRHRAPLLSRGGGTSLCGQCCNAAVVIDFSKYLNRIIEIDAHSKTAWVEPGVVLDDLRDAASAHGLTFAPDPATHNHNTLGGMIGNNSCGPHSVMGGVTADNVLELDVLTYGGARMRVGQISDVEYEAIDAAGGAHAEICRKLKRIVEHYGDLIRTRFPAIPRRVSGYNLPALLPEQGLDLAKALVGSEGTCAVILGARVRLVDNPAHRVLLVLGYRDVYCAGDDVPRVMSCEPIALEGMDERLVEDMKALELHPRNVKMLPDGRGWLLVEFGGATLEEARARANTACERLRASEQPIAMQLHEAPTDQAAIWKVRESGLGATAHVPNKALTWEGWEDSSVPPERLGEYLRKLRHLLDAYGYQCDLYGHFGQGCVHTRIDFDLETAAGIDKFRRFVHEAAELVVGLGGSISGEHGDGQSKAEVLPVMFGDELMQAFRDFKAAWDPDNAMNPGKVIDAYRADENLRLGTRYDPPSPRTHFNYPQDAGKFPRVMLRCVGVGECRKKSGTMCPSYMATMEEMHSTRGRARLLFEMLRGDVVTGGWQERAVHEALDLCLSCKGCKGECPVKVDMATYKAEFLAHYFERHWRPLAAHAFGRIDLWSRYAARAPRFANLLIGTPPFSTLAKKLLGVARERELTPYAPESFVQSLARHSSPRESGTKVILWPDTFNNYFLPTTAQSALRVLEAAGFQVAVPRAALCCGRPLYEWGLLDQAKRYLRRVLDTLREDIRDGTPIVVLEPACATVFRDELTNLFPADEQAKRLAAQVCLLSEFIAQHEDAFALPRLARRAVVHAHCHHKSVLGTQAYTQVLDRLELDYALLDSGCCGMAGSFGFEAAKYDVSMKCAERVLLPALRSADAGTLIVADGFSCREQIRQTSGQRTFHLAEVLDMGNTS